MNISLGFLSCYMRVDITKQIGVFLKRLQKRHCYIVINSVVHKVIKNIGTIRDKESPFLVFIFIPLVLKYSRYEVVRQILMRHMYFSRLQLLYRDWGKR
jgi:hypothetical protein